MTPISFEGGSAAGGMCGILARFEDARNYLALVLDRDGQLKLLRRREDVLEVIAAKPVEFCLGQSLTLTLIVQGNQATGTAGPYSGATNIQANIDLPRSDRQGGCVGFLADIAARFGPLSVECTEQEAARIKDALESRRKALSAKRARYPGMRLERTFPLHKLVNGRNLRIADINGDGKPEIIVAQSSPNVASKWSLTRLTCLSVLDMDGKLLWQAGIPDANAPLYHGELPFQIHDLYGDGGKVIVCVFGYDIQVRDGRTGRVLFSAATPETVPVGSDFKELTSNFGTAWGDETLNMNVAYIGFCNTQGNGGRREIIVKDEFHHLVVLDGIMLQPLFKHRGNHGRYPWVGDVDGDGKDEILAGYSLIDEHGKSKWSLGLGDRPFAVAVLDPLAAGGTNKRVLLCAGAEGLLFFNSDAHVRKHLLPGSRLSQGHNATLAVCKLRTDVPGLQIFSAGMGEAPGLFNLYDATGKRLWSKQIAAPGALAFPINWTGRAEELLMLPGAGLIDGHGDIVVDIPRNTSKIWYDVSAVFSADGRDHLLAWDQEELAVYAADDKVTGPVYKPVRPNPENASAYRAQLSLPPGWE